MTKIKVNIAFDNKNLSCEKGSKLSDILTEAGYEQNLVCGGNGKCKKCSATIKLKDKIQKVLTCQYKISEDIQVISIDSLKENSINILTGYSHTAFKLEPELKLFKLTTDDIRPDHCSAITKALEEKYGYSMTYQAYKVFSRMYSIDENDKAYGFVIFDNEIIDVTDANKPIYAMAIDIGTTTVALYIYNMSELCIEGTYSAMNPQTAFGADVISRIGYCIQNKEGTDILREKITSEINVMLDKAKNDGIETDRIYQAAIAGNSTMQHLFLGFNPANLGKAPFTPITMGAVTLTGEQALLNIHPNAIVSFLPLIGGFVGADTTAVIASVENDDKARMMIDLGTNGEIACGKGVHYIAASTACGPALEGAGLSCGMRAAKGAIDKFSINEDKSLNISVIGGGRPKGICGSGVIDILSELLKHGVINERGRMLAREDYIQKYGSDSLSERIMEEDGLRYFLIAQTDQSADGNKVYFSIKDVRQIQLAKAAIYTGCEMVAEKFGKEEISQIYLAGAFGNYINIKNAQYIGLLPDFKGVPICAIGNAAGTGAQMYILNKKIKQRCEDIKNNAEHMELNFNDSFQQTYFDNMLFKNI